MSGRGNLGTFEQVGAAFARHHAGREPIVRSVTVNMTAAQAQRFDAAHNRYDDKLAAEAFALLALQSGLPKMMEQAMFDELNRTQRREDDAQRRAPMPEPHQAKGGAS